MGAILHIHNKTMPPDKSSGGANRLAHWLALEQIKHGHKVYVMSHSGSSCGDYNFINIEPNIPFEVLETKIPDDVTDIEVHGGLSAKVVDKLLDKYKRSIQIFHAGRGGGKKNVFLSMSHAKNANSSVYAYNGIPVEEYIYSEEKENFFLFLAKVKRSKKGVDTAIRLSKKNNSKLIIAGGRRLANPETWFSWHPLIKPVGYVDGPEKFSLISRAKALIVPIRWEEPFGLTVIEAMASGTPVIAFNRGAMKELIIDVETGFICENEDEMLDVMSKVNLISPKACRDHAANKFSSFAMYEKHKELLDVAGSGKIW